VINHSGLFFSFPFYFDRLALIPPPPFPFFFFKKKKKTPQGDEKELLFQAPTEQKFVGAQVVVGCRVVFLPATDIPGAGGKESFSGMGFW